MDREQTQLLHEMVPFAKFLGMKVLSAEPEQVRGEMPWTAELCTVDNVLHGGAIMAFADTLGAACAYLNLPEEGQSTSTLESKSNFFRSVTEGLITGVSEPLHRDNRTVVVETAIWNDDENSVARILQTQAVSGPK